MSKDNQKVELEILSMTHGHGSNPSYSIVLGETEGRRRLSVVIGAFEAQAIALAMEKMTPNRPMTHDLIKSAFDSFDIEMTEVVINNLVDGVFFSQLVCQIGGVERIIDSRTSDALSLAVRFKCPIHTYEFVMGMAGIDVPDGNKKAVTKTSKISVDSKDANVKFRSYSLEELNARLDKAIGDEDYLLAAQLRDELNNRK
jgi:uncharacterized protein